jgi:hypothetical protein
MLDNDVSGITAMSLAESGYDCVGYLRRTGIVRPTCPSKAVPKHTASIKNAWIDIPASESIVGQIDGFSGILSGRFSANSVAFEDRQKTDNTGW